MDPFQNMPTPTAPEPEVEARMATSSAYTVIGETVTDRRDDKTVFSSSPEAGSSAIYARDGGTLYLKNPEIHGWGEMTPQDLRNELGSKYGFCAAVLSNQKTSHVTLVNPKIVCHESSTANGAYAIFGGAVVIEGGTIDTCNRQGHGVDASYGGHVYCNGTKIHTGGMNSGALATDFQGGYITVRDIEAVTEIPGSPGIYTAGKSIITAYNSSFVSRGCEAVMVAHSLGHTYLYDCDLTGTVGLNTHNSMSPEYSYVHMFGGTLNSTAGSILCAEDGKAVMNLDHVSIGQMADGNLAFAKAGGRLVANLADMDVTGNAGREETSYLEINLKGTTLSGAVNATALSVDGASAWTVTGDSRIAVLALAGSICAPSPVTVAYGALAEGTVLPEAENVTFLQDPTIVDDYKQKMMMPPPGEGPGAPSGPDMPPPPPMG
ncbi:MAG: right-handed parallel beta-helix repeat-containing protein [Oscillospiraceae bacterium]|nr:right-handed parallel beta-helix repeat-containing protein [Oscillospiraceae bacterium]